MWRRNVAHLARIQRVLCGVCAICCALRIRQVCLAKKQNVAKQRINTEAEDELAHGNWRQSAQPEEQQRLLLLLAMAKDDRFLFDFVSVFVSVFCVFVFVFAFVLCCYSFLVGFFSALSSSRRSWSCVGGKCEIALAFFSFFLIFFFFFLFRFSWLRLPANALIG